MKHRILSALAALSIIAAASISTGCKTSSGGTAPPASTNTPNANLERTRVAVEVAAETGVIFLLKEKPEARPYIVVAIDAINTAVGNKAVDPQVLRESLAQLIESDDPDIWIAVTAGLNLYRLYFAGVLTDRLDQNQYALPVLNALAVGMLRGISATAPPIPK